MFSIPASPISGLWCIAAFAVSRGLEPPSSCGISSVSIANESSQTVRSETVVIQAREQSVTAEAPFPVDESPGGIIVRRKSALGDVIMATGVLRQIATMNPNKTILFETDYHELAGRLPGIEVVPHIESTSAHKIDLNLAYEKKPKQPAWRSYAEAAGLPEGLDLSFHFSSSADERNSVLKKLGEARARSLAVVHGSSSWPSRTWPVEHWRRTIKALSDMGYSVVVVGRANDLAPPPCAHVHDLRMKLDLGEIRELCKLANVFVGMDSGILHVAQTTSVSIVGMFTVVNPAYRVYPREGAKTVAIVPALECRYCLQDEEPPVTTLSCRYGTNLCVQHVEPGRVIAAAREFL